MLELFSCVIMCLLYILNSNGLLFIARSPEVANSSSHQSQAQNDLLQQQVTSGARSIELLAGQLEHLQ